MGGGEFSVWKISWGNACKYGGGEFSFWKIFKSEGVSLVSGRSWRNYVNMGGEFSFWKILKEINMGGGFSII